MNRKTSDIPDMGIIELARNATRYVEAMHILARFGISLKQGHDGQYIKFKGNSYSLDKHCTFSEALAQALRDKENKQERIVRGLETKIRELEYRLPKIKEIELSDGHTMQIIED